VSGLFALQYLVDKGVIDRSMERTCTRRSCVGVPVDSLRLNEAHGRGIALQLNRLLDAGAFTVPPTDLRGRCARIRDAVTALTRDIMTLQPRQLRESEGHARHLRGHASRGAAGARQAGTILSTSSRGS